MDETLKHALNHIVKLEQEREADAEAQALRIELLLETIEELEEANRALKGQVQFLLNERRYPDLKVV
jgi:hypothetical protein